MALEAKLRRAGTQPNETKIMTSENELEFLNGGGEMAELIRRFDWAQTSLGAIERWPEYLKNSVGLMLQSPVPIILLMHEPGHTIYNDAYAEFAAERHPKLLGLPVVDAWPEVADFNRNVMKQGLAGKTLSYHDQALTLYRNGKPELVSMDLNYSPIRGEDGRPAGVMAIVVETTDRIKGESASGRLAAIVESSDDAIVSKDLNGIIQTWNKSAEKIFGYSAEEAIGRSITMIIPPERLAEEDKIMANIRNGRRVDHFETLRKRKDGTLLDVSLTISPIRNSAGEVMGASKIARDISDRKLNEVLLTAGLARQAAFFNTALDAVVTIDQENRITEFNPAAERIFGWKRKEALGRDLADTIIPPAFRDYHRHGLAHYLKSGQGAYIDNLVEVTAVRKNGEEFPVELAITQIEGEGPPAFMGTLRDISARKAAEEKLKQSEAQQEFLLALADTLRPLVDAREIKDTGARMLGDYLGVNRVYYVEVEPDGKHVTVEDNYRKDAPSVAGHYNLFDFGAKIKTEYESSNMVIINNAPADKRLPRLLKLAWKAKKIGSMAGVPLTRNGKLVAALGMDRQDAHDWTEDEISMLDAVAERIWSAIERTRTEAALVESERRYRFVVQNASDIITVIDGKGVITYQSPSISRVLGWPPKTRPGINIFDSTYVHPDDKAKKDKFIKQLMRAKSGSQLQQEFRMKDTSGNWHYMDIIGINLLHLKGVEGIILSSRDTTERRRNRQHLKESRERLELAEYVGNMGSFEWNLADGKIIWSKAQERLHGLAPGGFKGTLEEWQALIHPDDFQMVLDHMMKCIEEKSGFEAEWRIVRPNGEELTLAGRAQLFFDKAGQPVRILGTDVDITDRKRYERQKDEFIAVASHELKTPVTSMKMYAAALERRFKRSGDEASAEAVVQIDNQLNRLNTLIRDLLDVTKIEAGQLRLRRAEFSYDELLKQTIAAVQITTDLHHIKLTGLSKCRLNSDRERLGQVLTNLLVNAVKYSPKSPEITVRVYRDKKDLITSVIDHGIGIPKANQPGLFERFSRVGGKSTDNYPGLGLGLFISARIIDRLGGRIWVESKYHRGSTFSFSLPLNDTQRRMNLK